MLKNSLVATRNRIMDYFDQLLTEPEVEGYYYYRAITVNKKNEKTAAVPYMKILKK